MKKTRKKIQRKKRIIKYWSKEEVFRYFLGRFALLLAVLIPCLIILALLPKEDPIHVVEKFDVIATAYSSTIDQTDDTPCITANGFDLCKNGVEEVVASNYLKFGTKVRFPELFGDRIFVVHDRMNARFGKSRMDIWMTSRGKAVDFGVRKVAVEVVE